MSRRVLVFDTTLRDGEQSPGFSMNIAEKITLAKQLARLGVDVIEAGFPVASEGDFEAVVAIAREVRGPVIAGLSRAVPGDIDRCWDAVRHARRPRIHTFIATSDIHIQKKFNTTREEILRRAIEAVRHAKGHTKDVEFSAEDAFRSDWDYLCRVVEAVIDAGATTVNIPDTVGYAIPSEFGELIRTIRERVPNIGRAVLSVHCHDDLGLGVANSLAAVQNGAGQVECTVNGIGERAGNASLEEIAMALKTRPALFGATTAIRTEEITRTSRLLASITGIDVQPNKAIVGRNAFAHESGIHQDGVLKDARTYEIMTPESVGLTKAQLVLGKHSGKHAFSKRLQELGYGLTKEQLAGAFVRFKDLCDKKKEIFDDDIAALVEQEIGATVPETWALEYLATTSGTRSIPTATVVLRRDDRELQDSATGDGPVDAAYHAVDRITGVTGTLLSYQIRAVTSGKDALGEASIKVRFNGREFTARAASTDIVESSVRAYLSAINRMLAAGGEPERAPADQP
ncbi:MAG TPA: 2-isopropylmalate synthase [bacterium]